MSEITTWNAVGVKPTTEEIIAKLRKEGAFKQVKGSGEAHLLKDGSVGRSLAGQASQANKRALVLQTRMEGVVPGKFSYAASIKRFSDLQQTTGVMNLALAGLDLSFVSVNPFKDLQPREREHNICSDLISEIKLDLTNPDSQGDDSMAVLKEQLEKVKVSIPNEAVTKELDEIVSGLDQIRSEVFSTESINRNVVADVIRSEPTGKDSAKFPGVAKKTSSDYHHNTVRVSANAFACADLDTEKAADFKSTMRKSLQKSWTLVHKLEVLAKTQKNMQGATQAVAELKRGVRDILKTSDALLRREQEDLRASQDN